MSTLRASVDRGEVAGPAYFADSARAATPLSAAKLRWSTREADRRGTGCAPRCPPCCRARPPSSTSPRLTTVADLIRAGSPELPPKRPSPKREPALQPVAQSSPTSVLMDQADTVKITDCSERSRVIFLRSAGNGEDVSQAS